jgi:hypothetical protein
MSHPHARSSDVRRSLDHPVIDADGHYIETMPILKPFLIESVREIAGNVHHGGREMPRSRRSRSLSAAHGRNTVSS